MLCGICRIAPWAYLRTLLYAAAFRVWARKRACAFPRIPKTSPISPIRRVSIGQALCGQLKRNVSMTSTEAVKFMLVDDIAETISALEALLRRAGLEIFKARPRREGLERKLVT